MEKLYTSTFKPSVFATDILKKGKIIQYAETPQDAIERVVNDLSSAEYKFGATRREMINFANQLGNYMDEKKIALNTSILTNAGREHNRPLSACSVPVVDLRGDLNKVKITVDTYHKEGMGTGFNFSNVDDPVRILNFLNDLAISGLEEGKEDRSVGNIGICRIDHPGIMEFIAIKTQQPDKKWMFNISVDIPNAFWHALQSDSLWKLKNNNQILARTVFDQIISSVHASGDPGVIFLDRLNEDNPTPGIGEYISTAPCAEMGLVAGETCQFGYINLAKFVKLKGISKQINYQDLEQASFLLVRALDNALELSLERFSIPTSKLINKARRKIGVGVCGFADLLIDLELSYDSIEARKLAKNIFSFINFQTKIASFDLAKRRGSFEAMDLSISCRYLENPGFIEKKYGSLDTDTISAKEWNILADQIRTTRLLRNCSTIALPPTGRSSLIVDASASIEPLFDLRENTSSYLGLIRRLQDINIDSPANRILLSSTGSGQFINMPDEMKSIYKTATEIDIYGHLSMVSAIQSCVDESISKTINISAKEGPDKIGEIYLLAHQAGLKGITVYRNESNKNQPKQLVKDK
ncbi:MAG: hypothetical protein Q7R97_02345 [Candidatus Daviesbacteria bacterium]|nr:hypothetical protein [Candidatus Daviesbacteria bacterium]